MSQTKENVDTFDHDVGSEEDPLKSQKSESLDEPVLFRSPAPIASVPSSEGQDLSANFMPAEHIYLGDAIKLKLRHSTPKFARDYPFKFYDGLSLTYGQINSLAGDFYGTSRPICEGDGLNDQCTRFQEAYDTLAKNPERQPAECKEILGILQDEVNQIKQAIIDGKETSKVYSELPITNGRLQRATKGRPPGQPRFFKLARLNLDHFGDDARTAYNAGHTVALKLAADDNLDGAYAVNAFADHFLEDSFAAGHLRTPRRMLFGRLDKDACAKLMHDEDNAIGLNVRNPRGDSWKIFGDRRLGDNVNAKNFEYCKEAIQVSADEIYECWKSKEKPTVDTYQVWNIAPTLESANGKQDCCPFFIDDGKEKRRADITARRIWNFTEDFNYGKTAIAASTSGRWNYPITLDPKN